MPVEIEAKFRLERPDDLLSRLRDCGAAAGGLLVEDDTFFDTPDRRLLHAGCGLRLRRRQHPDRTAQAVLTYKGPRQEGPWKARPEEQTAVASPQAVEAILAGMGYEPVLRFTKRRSVWRLAEAEVCIDELPELGFFVEIEAPSAAAVEAACARLALDKGLALPATYAEMVSQRLEGTGRGRLDFPAPAGPEAPRRQ